MAKNQALRPDFFLANMPSLQKDNEAEKKGATEEERQLYNMSQSSGWKLLSEHLKRVLDELDQVNIQAIEQGASFEQIGQNTLVVSTAKSVIKRSFSIVSDAIEACEKPDEQG